MRKNQHSAKETIFTSYNVGSDYFYRKLLVVSLCICLIK